MAAKGGVGLRMHLDQVPLRDTSVGPEEILLSESQERMLLICEPRHLAGVKEVFERWGLDASVLGEVIPGPEVELLWKNEVLCKIDPKLLTDNAPMYERPFAAWKPKQRVEKATAPGVALSDAVASVQGTSRRWIFQQYDQRVGGKTVRDCEDSVAVLRLPKSGRGLGLVLGCRPHVMRMDAQIGGYDSAFYPALELSAKGFEPLAMTDCLNFGNPEKPEIMTEFVASVEALATASKLLDAPVISGNVSFYNETLNVGVTSTPSTGLVGLRPDIRSIPRSEFTSVGDEIVLWRLPGVDYASDARGEVTEFSGAFQPEAVAKWLVEVREVARTSQVHASRVVGKFGLGYALYRLCTEELGARVENPSGSTWSGEHLYEVLLVGPKGLSERLQSRVGAQAWRLGHVEKGVLALDKEIFPLAQLHQSYRSGWRKHFALLA
jgi:phosphoribosylformylglycinamidine (FGAM) synthase-like enzyme